ncbi:MAG TPA: hypothetical protein VK439_03085 [Rubrivivax sp.]|nr:hypothetical protein [Rubrivivax sp.]
MNNKPLMVLAGAWALCLPPLVVAQTGNFDPSQARQPAAPLRYESAFANYKPWQETKPGDWRAINDALLKDAAQAGVQAGPAAAMPVAKPSANPAPSTPGAKPAAKPASAASAGAAGSSRSHGHGGHR